MFNLALISITRATMLKCDNGWLCEVDGESMKGVNYRCPG